MGNNFQFGKSLNNYRDIFENVNPKPQKNSRKILRKLEIKIGELSWKNWKNFRKIMKKLEKKLFENCMAIFETFGEILK